MRRLEITLEDLFNLRESVIYNPDDYKSANHVTIDSRLVKRNSLFIAIKGERFDGHDYVREAYKKGASAVVIDERQLEHFNDIRKTLISVRDPVEAFGSLSNGWRKRLTAKVISLTGSNGKTSTKEMIASILQEKFKVCKSIGNNNNHLGVPLTIFSAKQSDEVLILEHGTNHFDEIDYTAKIAQPDVALITNIGESHLEFLMNKKGVFEEKKALLERTLHNNGTLLVNIDDQYLKEYANAEGKVVTYGFTGSPDVKGNIPGYDESGCTSLEVKYKKMKIKITVNLLGESNAGNLFAAVTVALILGMTKTQILEGIKSIKPVKGRLFPIYKKNFLLIDDSYNSNPVSVAQAIKLLNKIKKYRNKILILGDMFELGPESEFYHRKLSKDILKCFPDRIFLIGEKMSSLHSKLKGMNLNSSHYPDRETLKLVLRLADFSNSVVLVKGSRGMKMEEFVEVINNKAV